MKIGVAVIFWLASFQTMRGQVPTRSRAEQMHFSAEDENVQRPMVLPDEALALIEKDRNVAEILKNEEPPLMKVPRSWLMASEVHLDGPDERDIVVVAAGHLMGANGHDFAVLLTAPAHDLSLKGTRLNGYRDIEIATATAVRVSTVTFRFDGNRYTKVRQHSKDIR